MTLHDITRRIAVQEDPPSILRAAVDGVRDLLGTDASFAATVRRDLNVYCVSTTVGTSTPAFGRIVIPPMAGLGGRVAALRRPMAVHDYLTDESITRDFVDVVVHEEGLRGVACVPVRTTLGVEGLLYAALRGPGYLDDTAMDTLTQIGVHAGVAIDQAWAQTRRRELSVLQERQRLASSLHDSVAQTLFTIGVQAKRSGQQAAPGPEADALVEIAALAAHAGQELRDTLHRINAVPARLSLAVALDAEARAFERLGDLTVRVVSDGEVRPVPEAHEALICETVHEGVRNAVKHGRAKLVVVHLRYGEEDLGLTVQSDRGGDEGDSVDALRPRGGLSLLRARARALRGALELLLGEEGEAIVRLRLPRYDAGLVEVAR